MEMVRKEATCLERTRQIVREGGGNLSGKEEATCPEQSFLGGVALGEEGGVALGEEGGVALGEEGGRLVNFT